MERSTERVWKDYEDERIDMIIAGPKLKFFHKEKERIEQELARQEPEEKIVSLHPAAIKRYEKHVENLSNAFEDGITSDNEEAASALRDLVEKIIVGHDADGQLSLAVHGRLAALTEAEQSLPQHANFLVGGVDGSGRGT